MKLTAGCLLIVLLAGAFNFAFAQTGTSGLRGKVQAENNTPADAATVVLLNSKDSSVVRSTISSKNGQFSFASIQAGSYLVFITKLNYNKSYSGPYVVAQGKNADIGAVTLIQGATALKEVSISGKKDFVEVRADKTVLNVDQNIMATGSSLYDVLGTSPGVKVNDEDVLYRGGQKALIAIDGKPVLLSGEELINLLKNYQSSTISQIELIDNPPAKYGASGGGGMINIVLKKNKDLGSNATVSQTAAYGDKYKFITGINYNLRTEKLNVFAGYNYTNTSIPHTINTNRLISTGNATDDFDLDYYADIKSRNNSFSLGADYKLTERQTLGFLVNGYDNNSTIDKRSTTTIGTNGQPDSSIKTQSTIKRNINNFNYNLNYKANLGKSGKTVLSADADYSDYHRHSDELLENDFFNSSGQASSSPLFYSDSSPSHITVRSENIDFSQALSKTSSFEAGIKNSQVNSNNIFTFDQQQDVGRAEKVVPTLPDSLSSRFMYKERINSAYLKFDTKFDKTSLSLSIRVEQTNSSSYSVNPNRQSDSSYINWFPNIQVTQDLGKDHQLTLFYARNINRPNYQDLNPFVAYVDQFYSTTGNPFLKPSYINTYQVSDLYLKKYKVALSMIVTDRYYNTIFHQNDTTNAYTTSKANIGTRYQYVAEFNIPVDITNWWSTNTNLSVFHERYDYNVDTLAKKSTNGLSVNMTHNFKITPKLTAQLVADYESPTYFVISQYQAAYYVNAGFSYSIMHNSGRIRLAFNDIFNSDYLNKYHTNYTNLNLTGRDKAGSRFIQASFTYHFGNLSLKAHANRDNIEEQKRLGTAVDN